MRKYKNKIITGVLIAVVLAIVYWWGGNAPELRGWKAVPKQSSETADVADMKEVVLNQEKVVNSEIQAEENEIALDNTAEETQAEPEISEESDMEYSEANGMEIDEKTGTDEFKTSPVPEGKPVPVEPQNAVITDTAMRCTLSVRCDNVLKNMDWLDENKKELVPGDGVIFEEQEVVFYEGESVFNVLVREMKKNKIHLEFINTPVYNSVYIEGINNLYEFDCGELSGWRYKVNDWFPNYGCSRYQLKDGDRIAWVYTCNSGVDVGGLYMASQKDE